MHERKRSGPAEKPANGEGLVIGKTYLVTHVRDKTVVGKVLAVDAEWVDLEVLPGGDQPNAAVGGRLTVKRASVFEEV